MGGKRGPYIKQKIDLQLVADCGSAGLSIADTCRVIGCSRSKFDNYRDEDNEFNEQNPDFNPAKDTYYRSKSLSIISVLDSVKSEAVSGKNMNAAKIWLDAMGYGKKSVPIVTEQKTSNLVINFTPPISETSGITIDQPSDRLKVSLK